MCSSLQDDNGPPMCDVTVALPFIPLTHSLTYNNILLNECTSLSADIDSTINYRNFLPPVSSAIRPPQLRTAEQRRSGTRSFQSFHGHAHPLANTARHHRSSNISLMFHSPSFSSVRNPIVPSIDYRMTQSNRRPTRPPSLNSIVCFYIIITLNMFHVSASFCVLVSIVHLLLLLLPLPPLSRRNELTHIHHYPVII